MSTNPKSQNASQARRFSFEPAGYFSRFASAFIDLLVLNLILPIPFCYLGSSLNLFSFRLGAFFEIYAGHWFSWIVLIFYFGIFDSAIISGSIGKKCLGITVVDNENSPASLGKSFVRAFLKLFSIYLIFPSKTFEELLGVKSVLFFLLGFGFIFLPLILPENKAIHDYLSQTRVVSKE